MSGGTTGLIILTPCPWCPEESYRGLLYDREKWSGICWTCGARGPLTETCEEAVKRWNKEAHGNQSDE